MSELIEIQCLPGMTIPVERFLNSVCEMWAGNCVFFFSKHSQAPPALCPGLFLVPGGLLADKSTICGIKLVFKSPVRLCYWVSRGSNQDQDRLAFFLKLEIT